MSEPSQPSDGGAAPSAAAFALPAPELQIAFTASLATARQRLLQDALLIAVRSLSVPEIDAELAKFVPSHSLSGLAAHGIRGELMFPVPTVLRANPRLLGYYRLLYGFSQKEFYTLATGFGRMKGLEERGQLSAANAGLLEAACAALCETGATLLAGIGTETVSRALLDDLTLLTLGPQLRGGANVRRGTSGIRLVFDAIHKIVSHAVVHVSESSIELKSAAGSKVLIEFAPDPDIIIRTEMRPGAYRELIAIEVKAGMDFSNIHNRLGEAEKSHQKAKGSGYSECWTVVNVDRMDMVTARRESPSTNRFYKISDLVSAESTDYTDFRDRIVSMTGILPA